MMRSGWPAPPASVTFCAGVAGIAIFPAVAPLHVILVLAALAIGLAGIREVRPWAALAIGLAWGQWGLSAALESRWMHAQDAEARTVHGWIANLPQRAGELTRFDFVPDRARHPELPPRIRLAWYRDAPPLRSGDAWTLQVRLRPPRAALNLYGPDLERNWLVERIGGLGTVQGGAPDQTVAPRFPLQRARQALSRQLDLVLAHRPGAGVVRALALGERDGLDAATRARLTDTGTAHLLAVSGLHVGLASGLGWLLGRALMILLPVAWASRARRLPLFISLAVAIAYAALAGFGLPTQRAVLMLMAWIATTWTWGAARPWRAWWLALGAVLLLDPLAPLAPGAWLSFGAVAVLLWTFGPRLGRRANPGRALVVAQLAIGLALAPLVLAWFGRAPGLSGLANLYAVPWTSVVLVPLSLLGTGLLPLSTAVAEWPLAMAAEAADSLLHGLAAWERAAGSGQAARAGAGPLAFAIAFAGGLLLLLPRGLPVRCAGAALLLPVLWQAERPDGTLRLHVLDTGQGLATVLLEQDRALVYDSGPGDGHARSVVDAAIVPTLVAEGISEPGLLVISHADLDHAGGAGRLRQRYPHAAAWMQSRAPPKGWKSCDTRRQPPGDWSLQVLHPSPGLPYLGNDSSCVLSVSARGGKVLLPGDIGRAAELRLVTEGLGTHDVVVVPHHGSRSSSTAAFVQANDARLALSAAGAGNRFGFPHREAMQRWQVAGGTHWSTAGCGGLRVDLAQDGKLRVVSARQLRTAPWRWPAEPGCPPPGTVLWAREHANGASGMIPHRLRSME